MKAIGITGNIGSGKSMVCKILSGMGFPVFHADAEAAKIMTQPEIIMHLTDRFGTAILTNDGLPDRRKLASIVFNNPDALQWLNHLMHPKVMEAWKVWLEHQTPHPLCFMESAILFEHGLEQHFDKIVAVDAPEEVSLVRVMERDHVPEKVVLERMAQQMGTAEKRERADWVIDNGGTSMLLPQVVDMVEAFMQEAI